MLNVGTIDCPTASDQDLIAYSMAKSPMAIVVPRLLSFLVVISIYVGCPLVWVVASARRRGRA